MTNGAHVLIIEPIQAAANHLHNNRHKLCCGAALTHTVRISGFQIGRAAPYLEAKMRESEEVVVVIHQQLLNKTCG